MKAYSGRESCSSGTSLERSEFDHGSLPEQRQETDSPIKEVMGGIPKHLRRSERRLGNKTSS